MTKRAKQRKSRVAEQSPSDKSTTTAQRDAEPHGEVAAPPFARTYLPESIGVLLLCLTPVALAAIYYGLAARRASQEGNLTGANAASEMARVWFIFSICFGVVANIAILGAYLVSQKT